MSQDCCCFERCILNYKCDTQHKCVSCIQYIHAICGLEYYGSDGEVVEDLAYPRRCFQCSKKPKSHESQLQLKTKSNSNTAAQKMTTTESTSTLKAPQTTGGSQVASLLESSKKRYGKSIFLSDSEDDAGTAGQHDGYDDEIESDHPPMPPLQQWKSNSDEFKQSILETEEGEESNSDNESNDGKDGSNEDGDQSDDDDRYDGSDSSGYEELFTPEERKKYVHGFFQVTDLK